MERLLAGTFALSMLAGCGLADYEGETVDSVAGRLPPLTPAMATTAEFVDGFAALEAGDYITAEAMLALSLEAQPNDSYALLAMGAVMELTGREFDATTYYRSAARYGGDTALGRTVEINGGAVAAGTVRELALANIARIETRPAGI